MADAPKRKITISLKTCDGDVFEVSPAIAKQMQTIQSFVEDDSFVATTTVIPLPNVTSFQLTKIIDYLNYHHNGKAVAVDRKVAAKKFDEEFVKELDHEQLKELLLAANYLNVKDVLDFLCQAVADLIQDKSVKFVRNFFGVVNDYTTAEEKEIRKTRAWAFEGVDEE
ncbi:hypothetical protein TanjilG_23897 [Lupinus angustifolius]|uniref:SKP1-like protein n=1 Tax=Lupinus angustifolius TaxID=3871 RepID=A0A1J7H518_LUPAN|nr:PREDICTED: SKP1-like protein 14 [Lupinus angustifolius]OIW01586.1 hypothetical protein TanjilG_23897 [Lupinus angustifolius]